MMEQPLGRFWTKASIDFLSTRLCLPNEAWMQDWAYEIADPLNLGSHLSVFDEVQENANIRFTLADVIVQATDLFDFLSRLRTWI